MKRGALVAYSDPFIAHLRLPDGETLSAVELTAPVLEWADCVLVHTAHSAFDWQFVADHALLVFDTRNVMATTTPTACRIARL